MNLRRLPVIQSSVLLSTGRSPVTRQGQVLTPFQLHEEVHLLRLLIRRSYFLFSIRPYGPNTSSHAFTKALNHSNVTWWIDSTPCWKCSLKTIATTVRCWRDGGPWKVGTPLRQWVGMAEPMLKWPKRRKLFSARISNLESLLMGKCIFFLQKSVQLM